MYRIFISHSSHEVNEAKALRDWLVLQDPPLANEIFLDADMMRAGLQWKSQLKQAMSHCEAVICLVSAKWSASHECLAEYRAAEYLDKRIFCARLESAADPDVDDITHEWQRVDLFGPGEKTKVLVDDGGPSVTFLTEGLLRLKDEIIKKGIGAESFVWPPPGEEDRAPYRGWAPLEEVDAAVYFGRDAELVRAWDKLRGMRKSGEESLFVILGPSGSGKSSFLRAGLLPRLRRADRNFVVLDRIVRPENNVLTGKNGLAEAIHATRIRLGLKGSLLADIQEACLNDTGRVRELLHEIQQTAARPTSAGESEDFGPPTLVIPVDQAEELFSQDARHEAPRFLDMIERHSQADFAQQLSLIVAITIRTDRHQALQTAKQLSETKSVVFDDLKPMPQGQFREVIVGPARRASQGGSKLEIDPELVDKLLADCDEGADTLPLLALTMARLYKEYGSDGDLTLAEYERMGGMHDVVQTEVDTILSDGPEKKARLALVRPAFVPWLATINRDNDLPVRRVANWDDLPDDAEPLLQQFVDRRLLMRDTRESGDVVEIALESLLRQWKELKDWLEEERGNLKQSDSLLQDADEWKERGRDDAGLLQGKRLEDAERLFTRTDYRELLAPAQQFVEASRRQADRRKWTSRGLLAAAVIVAVVAGVSLLAYLASERENQATARQNTAWQLVSQAEQMLKGSRPGGDVQALQKLLAADDLGATTAEAVANTRRDELKILENPLSGDGSVTSVRSIAVSPDGARIASANDDRTVRIWNTDSGSLVRELNVGEANTALAVAFSRDGKWLAAGSSAEAGKDEASLQVWNADTGERVGSPMAQRATVYSVAFSADGQTIATGSDDGTVRLWDRASGNEIANRPPAHEPNRAVRSVVFSPSGDQLVSGGNDGTVRMWNSRTGQQIIWPAVDRTPVMSVAFNPAGDRVVVGLGDGSVQTLDGRTLQPRNAAFVAHAYAVNSVAFSPDGHRIISGGADNTVRVWDAKTSEAIGDPLIGHHGRVSSVALNRDGTRIMSGGLDGSVRVWDAVTGVPTPAGQREVRGVAFSRDGRLMASGGTDGTVKLWDATTAAPVGQLGAPKPDDMQAINALAFSHNGDRIVTGAADGSVRLWDVNRREQIALLPKKEPTGLAPLRNPRVQSVAFSSDGSEIVSGGMDAVVRLWDAQTLEPLSAAIAYKIDALGNPLPYQIWSVAFSPDGNQLVTGSGFDAARGENNLVQLWNVDPLSTNGLPVTGHDGVVYSVAFSPDGRQVISGGFDGTARVWDVQTRQQQGPPMSVGQNPVLSVAFANENPWIVTGGEDGKVRLWDVSGDQPQPIGTPLEGHKNWVYSVAFSPHDDWILSGSRDGTLHLWPAPADLTDVICSKLSSNMSEEQWRNWISNSDDIRHKKLCDALPVPGDG